MAVIFVSNVNVTFEGEKYFSKDKISINEHGDLYVTIRGQRQGRMDYLIDDAIKNGKCVYIFSRYKTTDNFIYRGVGEFTHKYDRTVSVGINANKIEELSEYNFFIKNKNIINCVIPRNKLYNGSGCLKKACLSFIGHKDPNNASILNAFIKL